MNVLLVGAEAAGARCLQRLHESGHRVAAVMTARAEDSGAALAAAADRLGLPVLDPLLVRHAEFAAQVEQLAVDLLLNVHSLHVIHPEVIAAPRIGSFNLHPGPLPEYAGLSVPSWAIYRGERRHAVTVHWMAADVDAGHVAYEAELPISDTDTGLSLSVACVREGLPLIDRLLEDAHARRVPAREQDLARRRWHGPGSPHAGALPWTLPARTAVNLVRASDYGPFRSPWGRPRTIAAGGALEVLAAKPTGVSCDAAPGTVGDGEAGAVRVAAADEWVLVERVRDERGTAAAADRLEAGDRLRQPPVGT